MTETILNKNPAKSADLGEETLKAIEARCDAATPGPWRTEDCYSGVTTNVVCADRRTHGYGCGNDFICDLNDGDYHEYMSIGEQKANAEFIANAREDIPYLLDLLAERDAEIERLRKEVCKRCGVISGQLYGKCAACEYKPLPAPPEKEEV